MRQLQNTIFTLVLMCLLSYTGYGQNVGIGTTTPAYKLDVNGVVTSRVANGLRIWRPTYSVFHRNDDVNYYIMLTNSGDPDGSWNTLRPLRVELSTGNVRLGGNNTLFASHADERIGIGTLTPQSKLDVAGDIRIPGGLNKITLGDNIFINGQGTTGRISNNAYLTGGGWTLSDPAGLASTIELRDNGKIEMYGTPSAGSVAFQMMFGFNAASNIAYFPNGDVGIGTMAPAQKLDVAGVAQVDYLNVDPQNSTGEGGEIRLKGSNGNTNWQLDNLNGDMRMHANGGEWFVMNDAGKLSLSAGKAFPGNYKLYVRGGILSERVKVAIYNTGDWSDYVFAEDYDLKSLPYVEQYVKENKHLPNVPSAKKMVENGNDLGKTDAILLEKIEELFLHTIEQQKQIEALKAEVERLKKE